MNEQDKLRQAKEYIQAKRYGEARMVLRFMNENETALEWLAKLDQLDPQKPPPPPSVRPQPISAPPTPRPTRIARPASTSPRYRSLRDGASFLQFLAAIFMAVSILGGVVIAFSGSDDYRIANLFMGIFAALGGLALSLFFYIAGGTTKVLIDIEDSLRTQNFRE